uniref:Uncharacterized protein n=1 Tax=Setaria viridis TaxID=4556 RepID=A0A4U6T790_SETVI|nr:hypothetical protein SEVIR_9G444600v2 [Setaria viridis]
MTQRFHGIFYRHAVRVYYGLRRRWYAALLTSVVARSLLSVSCGLPLPRCGPSMTYPGARPGTGLCSLVAAAVRLT